MPLQLRERETRFSLSSQISHTSYPNQTDPGFGPLDTVCDGSSLELCPDCFVDARIVHLRQQQLESYADASVRQLQNDFINSTLL